MYSLTFLSAEQLAQDEENTCEIVEYMPRELYTVLFNVAFRSNKRNLLCELVKRWPYPQLKLKMLLKTCECYSWTACKKCPEYQWSFTGDETNKIDAIILGVISYIRKVITGDSQQPPNRRLKQLDMTGLLWKNYSWNLKVMRLWVKAVRQAGVYMLSQAIHHPQGQARNEVVTTFPMDACIDLLVDLHVGSYSEMFLKEALKGNVRSPIQLICRDFHTLYDFALDAVRFLRLLEPLAIRRIDLFYSSMYFADIRVLMLQISTCQNLQSLKLPSFDDTKWWTDHRQKDNFKFFTEKLITLRYLREFVVQGIPLSDLTPNLLGSLPCPLESLKLSYCSLKTDMSYLALSHHSSYLTKLDFTGNKIARHLYSFLELLTSVTNSLMWLNVARCGIKDSDFFQTMPFLYPCTRLSHLGLCDNPLSSRSMFVFMKSCQNKLPNLTVVAVPVFVDCCKNLPRHGPLPASLESNIDANKFYTVLNKLQQAQTTRVHPAILLTTSLSFDTDDYFKL